MLDSLLSKSTPSVPESIRTRPWLGAPLLHSRTNWVMSNDRWPVAVQSAVSETPAFDPAPSAPGEVHGTPLERSFHVASFSIQLWVNRYSRIACPAFVQFTCSAAEVMDAPAGTCPAPPPMSSG